MLRFRRPGRHPGARNYVAGFFALVPPLRVVAIKAKRDTLDAMATNTKTVE